MVGFIYVKMRNEIGMGKKLIIFALSSLAILANN